jgi:hypothetical protein
MNVPSVLIVVMGDSVEMEQFVRLFRFMSHKQSKAGEGKRLPANAENQQYFDETPHHARDFTALPERP